MTSIYHTNQKVLVRKANLKLMGYQQRYKSPFSLASVILVSSTSQL